MVGVEWAGRTPPSYYDAVRTRNSLSLPRSPDQLKYNSLPRPLPQRHPPADWGRQQYESPPKPANRVPLPLQVHAPQDTLLRPPPPNGWQNSLPRNGLLQRCRPPRPADTRQPPYEPRYSKSGTLPFQEPRGLPPPVVMLRTGPLGSYPDAETLAKLQQTANLSDTPQNGYPNGRNSVNKTCYSNGRTNGYPDTPNGFTHPEPPKNGFTNLLKLDSLPRQTDPRHNFARISSKDGQLRVNRCYQDNNYHTQNGPSSLPINLGRTTEGPPNDPNGTSSRHYPGHPYLQGQPVRPDMQTPSGHPIYSQSGFKSRTLPPPQRRPLSSYHTADPIPARPTSLHLDSAIYANQMRAVQPPTQAQYRPNDVRPLYPQQASSAKNGPMGMQEEVYVNQEVYKENFNSRRMSPKPVAWSVVDVVKPTPRHPAFQSVINELTSRHSSDSSQESRRRNSSGGPSTDKSLLSLSTSSLCSDSSSRRNASWDSLENLKKDKMASPWDREEKEKVARAHARHARDAEICRLESLAARTEKESEWLRILCLEKEFQRRAEEELLSSSGSESDPETLDVFHPGEKRFLPLDVTIPPSDDEDDLPEPPVPAPRPSKSTDDASSLSRLDLPDGDEWLMEVPNRRHTLDEENIYANLEQRNTLPRVVEAKKFPSMGVSSKRTVPTSVSTELQKLWVSRPEKLTFQDKIRKFSLQAGEDDLPRDRVKNSRAQREIEHKFQRT